MSFAHVKREYERASFKAELSRDKSKMVISYSLIDNDNMILSLGYLVMDASLKEIQKWEGSLNTADGVYVFDQYRLNNKGEVFLLTRYFETEKDMDKSSRLKKENLISTTRTLEYKANYEYRLIVFGKDNNARIVPLGNKNKFYDALDIGISSDGSPILIGFFSSPEKGKMPIGAVCLKVNAKSGSVQEAGIKEFGNEYEMPSDITIKNNGLAGKDQYLDYRFVVSDIHYNKSGGYTLIGERNVTQTKRTGNVIYTVNHLDDLAVVDVSAAGDVKGVYKVAKSQQAEGLQMFNASYFYTELNDTRYLAFANMGKSSSTESLLVKIAPNGSQTREVIFSTKDAEVTKDRRMAFC